MSTSNIDEQMINAYLETHFVVLSEPSFTLIVDKHSPSLVELYRLYSVKSAVFIAACNPYSKLLSDVDNRARNASLLTDFNKLDTTVIAGMGQDPAGQWPGEPSLFALGIEKEVAKELGNKYEQNAIVWCGSNAVPELLLLR
ncbi:MAG: DUF3293 domain-containing protein [Cycloclasticus sp.]|nr:DUF3293 domain-containing protein [Cycloclasticus sp.]